MSDSTTRPRRKRVPAPAIPGEIKVSWGKTESYDKTENAVYQWGAYGAYKGHTWALMQAFENVEIADGRPLLKYLEDEGFDLTTLKFSIRKAKPRARDGSLPD